MFLVILRRSGPEWDRSRPMEEQSGWPEHAAFMDGLVDDGFVVLGGPLADEVRTAHVVEAESEDAVRATWARDPWSETHLRVESIDPWTIRLDGRHAVPAARGGELRGRDLEDGRRPAAAIRQQSDLQRHRPEHLLGEQHLAMGLVVGPVPRPHVRPARRDAGRERTDSV